MVTPLSEGLSSHSLSFVFNNEAKIIFGCTAAAEAADDIITYYSLRLFQVI